MAESIYLKGEGGVVWKHDLPLHPDVEEKVVKGYLTRVNKDGSPYTEKPEPVKRPAKGDAKSIWVGWAVRAHGVAPDDAEALTKADLIDRYDRDPAPEAPVEPVSQPDGEQPSA